MTILGEIDPFCMEDTEGASAGLASQSMNLSGLKDQYLT